LRWTKTIKFRVNHLNTKAVKLTAEDALLRARAFRRRMQKAFPVEDGDVDWKASFRRLPDAKKEIWYAGEDWNNGDQQNWLIVLTKKPVLALALAVSKGPMIKGMKGLRK
jgi:sugar phosphate isomerase/epimerase